MIAKVSVRENILHVFLPGCTICVDWEELTALENNTFNVKNLVGRSLKFNSDNSGIITSVYFIGLNGASQAMKIK